MKLFTAIATASPVEARPNRTITWQGDTSADYRVDPVGSDSIELVANNEYNSTGFIAVRNCKTGDYRWRANTGYSKKSIMNNTRIACTMPSY